jgi:hypothetical protein
MFLRSSYARARYRPFTRGLGCAGYILEAAGSPSLVRIAGVFNEYSSHTETAASSAPSLRVAVSSRKGAASAL